MENALLRTLMNKEFNDNHKGLKCPTQLFTKDGRRIKGIIDRAIEEYGRSVTPAEVRALFFSESPTMTTAQKAAYNKVFDDITEEHVMGEDVAADVLSALFRQFVGDQVANIGFEMVNGEHHSLEPLRELLEEFNDDFTPNISVEWDNYDVDELMKRNEQEAQWKFNIATLSSKVEGINAGHLIEVGARPNTGKTSSHASLVAGPNGFFEQGAKVVVLCNEEAVHRVAMRYLNAYTGMTISQLQDNKAIARDAINRMKDKILFKDATGKDMQWVESMLKMSEPDIVILDMGDKFAKGNGQAREDQVLKENAIYARQLAKTYNCAIFYMSQLSAEAEGKVILNQSMMEGSRTGKAAEADLMLLIARNPIMGDDPNSMEDPMRHINLAKNKLSGWHGKITCTLDGSIARYGV